MAKVFFLIGGNLGNREGLLQSTIEHINKEVGRVIQLSSIYETAPWGFTHEQHFLNQVVVAETSLQPLAVLDKTQAIELSLGRKRKKNRYSERTIDIDILFYDSEVIDTPRLEVPHPRMAERKFALIPLNEVANDFKHPVFNKTIEELLAICTDKLEVIKLTESK